MTRVQDVYPDDRVSLREVGLRDGLQLVKTFPSTRGEAALDARRIWRRRAAFRGRLVPAREHLSAVRRRAGNRPDGGGAARRARHCAGAQRARRQRGAGLRRCRNRLGGLGHRRAQPGQCQPLARCRRSPMSNGCANCATRARTSRSSMPRSRWRWAVRSRGRSIRRK